MISRDSGKGSLHEVRRMLAVMFTLNTYGTWLRGDARGWVDQGVIFPADPELEASDRARMKHAPYCFAREARQAIGVFMGRSYGERLGGRIYAMHVGNWHVHLVAAYLPLAWGAQVKCLKDAVRWGLRPGRAIWSDGYDKRFCFDEASVRNRIAYVRRHNLQDGLPPDPWEFIVPFRPR